MSGYGYDVLFEALKAFSKFYTIAYESATPKQDSPSHDAPEQEVRTGRQVWQNLGFIARETVMERCNNGTKEDQITQVRALLRAA